MARPKAEARSSLFAQLLVALTLLAATPLVVLGIEQTLAARAAAKEAASREARVVSTSLARELGRVMQARAQVVQTFAASWQAAGATGDTEAVPRRFLDQFPAFYIVLATDAKGVTLAAAPATRPDGSPTRGTYYGDRGYFKKVLGGADFASELLKSRTTGKPSVILAAPLRTRSRAFNGVALAGVSLELIQQAVDRVTATAPGLASVVVDEKGRVVVAAGGPPRSPLQDLSGQAFFAAASSSEPETRSTPDEDAEQRSGTATRVESRAVSWTVVASWSQANIHERTTDALVKVLLFALAALALGALLALVLSRAIARAVTRLAEVVRAMQSGDLRVRAPPPGRFDSKELVDLSVAIDEMQIHSGQVIRQLGRTSQALLEVTLQLERSSRQLLADSREQQSAVSRSAGAIGTISASLGNLGQTVEGIFGAAEATSTSVSGFNQEISHIADSLRNLAQTIEDASAYIRAMGAEVDSVSTNANALQSSVSDTDRGLEKLVQAISLTTEQAQAGQRLAFDAMEVAEVGRRSVQDTIAATRDIRGSFAEVEAAVQRLSGRSAAIGEVVQVIDRVLEGTHLLAINASIIAAEAGEHGRKFRVVAEQVKSVARETTASTAEVLKLVRTVQTDIKAAVEAVRRGQTTVETGEERSAQAGERLQGIIENSQQAAKVVHQIDQTTREQSSFVHQVQHSLSEVNRRTSRIGQAMNVQRQVQEAMAKAITRVQSVGEEVRNSTAEQRKSSAQMSDGLQHTAQKLRIIAESLESQTSGHTQIEKGLRVFDDAARSNVFRAKELDGVVDMLRVRLRQLQTELSAFKVQ